jgi:DNA-binding IclR family transcriptional regulator
VIGRVGVPVALVTDRRLHADEGRPAPTLDELAERLGCSRARAEGALRQLVVNGWLQRSKLTWVLNTRAAW